MITATLGPVTTESTLSPKQKKREAARVVRSEKEAPMVLRGAEKQIAEDNAQFRRYRRAKAADYRRALEGPTGDLIKRLHDVLKQMDADVLLELIATVDWQSIDQEVRYTVLSMIDDAIVRLREQHGLAPFDNSIFDEDPTVFEICKAKLGMP